MACRSCRLNLGLVPLSPRRAVDKRLAQQIFAASQQQQQQTRRLHKTPTRCQQPAPEPNHHHPSAGERVKGGLQKMIFEPMAEKLATVARKTTQPYIVYGATERMYKTCAAQAEYNITKEARRAGQVKTTAEGEEIGVGGGMWHDDFGLLPTFSTWAHVTMLHMYLLVVRLRCLDRDAHHLWQAQLVDHFFHQAEDKMDVVHDMASRTLRQRYLQDLFVQWRGVLLAYDEGVVKGDAVLASAVWRNLFKAREDVDLRTLAAVVSWMRLCLKNLDQMQDAALTIHGPSVFKWPAAKELLGVDKPARALDGIYKETPQKHSTSS
ncbi:ubiquinol-cytochrome C chaperone-domain-containing protein [Diplogelasinospora grovesii]|uniref:Ubiquinol-cytochrome C chaperone-domain-containing protein n=1 Tax=Diplogelasinospora grovesii TaxID=303347 RepID=A0AAN6S788_9PEZI|nr:ubiquinol-cytochrome C chaperone-domain-containing protein [Diplogelasinospora grovesii]